ncbi:MAG: hypothetical protein P8046_14565 [Anaerolineales bacterium]
MENWTEAERLIKESAEVFQKADLQQDNMKFVWGSLAEIYITKGMPDKAVEQIDLILEDRETSEINPLCIGLEIRLFYICCRVLLACNDQRAQKVIETAYSLVQEYAAKIESEELRKSFLNNVPWNKKIIDLWEAEQGEKEN